MKKYKVIITRIILIILIFLWMNTVFGFSSQESESSTSLSLYVTSLFIKDVELQKVVEPIVRKLAHFSEYAVGGILFLGFFETFKISAKKKIIFASIVGILYAITDEIHQLFVPGRSGAIFDVGIDTLGVIVGVILLKIVLVICKKIKDRV